MYAKMPFDAQRYLAPISQLIESGNMLSAHPSVPARSVKELMALAKQRPGALTVASPGRGGSPHTPRAIIERLYEEAGRAVCSAEMGEKLRREALDVVAKGPDTFATLIATDVTKWAKVVKASGLQPQ